MKKPTLIKQTGCNQEPTNSIPKDWEWKYLHELGSFSKGKGILKEQVSESGLPCIRYGEIYTTHDFILKEFKSFISEDVATESLEIKKGDVLFAGSGETIEEIGKAVAYVGDEKAFAGGDVIVLSTKDKDKAEWISYVLETDIVKRQKRRIGQGNSVVHIYPSDLASLKIPYAPKKERQSISAVLNLHDMAITKFNLLVYRKELQKKWLMQNLLSGRKRLKGFKDEWKEYHLANFIEELNEKPKDGVSYEILTSSKTGLMKQTDYYGENRITNREDADYNVIPPNYLTYRSRSEEGLFTFNKNNFGVLGLVSGYYPVFRIKNGSTDFILSYCNFHKGRLKKYSIGTSQVVLSINALKSAVFKLPNEAEQTAIAKVIQAADNEIQLLKAKTDKLREKKNGLMQILLTGKKRIKI